MRSHRFLGIIVLVLGFVSAAESRPTTQKPDSDIRVARNWSSYAFLERAKNRRLAALALRTPSVDSSLAGNNAPFPPDGLSVASTRESEFSLIINGRLHIDYWGFPNGDGGVETLEDGAPKDRVGFRRIRVSAKGTVRRHIIYKIEIEFANPDDTEWRDSFIGFRKLPILQKLLIGNQKRPYGLDHLNSSRYNIFLERPMFIDAFNDDARRMGVVTLGKNRTHNLSWMLGGYSGDKIQDDAAFYKSDRFQGEIAGRLAATPYYDKASGGKSYVHLAVSGTFAFPDGRVDTDAANTAHFRARPEARSDHRWVDTGAIQRARTYQLVGVENVVNFGRFQWAFEGQYTRVERDDADALSFWGAYAYVSFFITDDYMSWDRKTGTLGRIKPSKNLFILDEDNPQEIGSGAWQVAFRYSMTDLSDGDIRGGVAKNLTVGVNWYFNAFSRLQFNYIRGQISDSQTLFNEATQRQSTANYDILGARLMVDF